MLFLFILVVFKVKCIVVVLEDNVVVWLVFMYFVNFFLNLFIFVFKGVI